MSLQDKIINQFTESILVHQEAMTELCDLIEYASVQIVSALLNDKRIFCCGNGRSATSSLQFSSALLNQYERDRPSLPVISLNTDVATLTAIANDLGFDEVFAKQLRALGQQGDILMVFCTNGRSANIIKAIHTAHDSGLQVIAITGGTDGLFASLLSETDIEIRAPSLSNARIQEIHVLIINCLCNLIDSQLFST
jgi:D-sedoheptulose 7-phosphate isomerase